MKKKNEFVLKTLTDIKVYMLYLLDHIAYPVDHRTLIEIVSESTSEISLDYDDALRQLVDSKHIIFDEVDGEKYYRNFDVKHSIGKSSAKWFQESYMIR